MRIEKYACVIVDAFCTGKYLAPAFRARGYPCIHVLSSKDLPKLYEDNIIKDDFIEALIYDGDLDKLVSQLKAYSIKCVVPGSEPGVLLADLIADKLNISIRNPLSSSKARRNKYEMHQKLKENKLESMDHFKSSEVKSILDWAEPKIKESPVVIKPLDSCGSEGVSICHNKEDIENAFEKIHNKKNSCGSINSEVLIQGYIDGDEYNVNFVSYQGKHILTEMIKVDKVIMHSAKIYDRAYFMHEEDKNFHALKEYTKKVLDALEIKNGPSHAEIIIRKKDNVPVLIEVAARCMGHINLSISSELRGTNQVSLIAEAYLEPEGFVERFKREKLKNEKAGKEIKSEIGEPVKIQRKHAHMIQLICHHHGTFSHLETESIRRLPSFYSLEGYWESGRRTEPTIDVFTSPGVIFLVSDSLEQIDRDYKKIRQMEHDNLLYKLKDVTSGLTSGIATFKSAKARTQQTKLSAKFGFAVAYTAGLFFCSYKVLNKVISSGVNPQVTSPKL